MHRTRDGARAALTVGLYVGSATLLSAPAEPARGQCAAHQRSRLAASDAAAGHRFGRSVAVDGNTLVIGADHAGAANNGAAYVFVRVNDVWVQQAKLIAADAATDTQFGTKVAVSGDTIVVGAHEDNHHGALDAGAAYVFVRAGGAWTQQTKLIASDFAADDWFGLSVAIDGDTALVGAALDDHEGGNEAGSVYVFERSGQTWTQRARLTAADAAAADVFGEEIAIDGNTAVIGALQKNLPGLPLSGAAYVFVREAGVWTQQARLTPAFEEYREEVGAAVAIFGDTVLIGAPASGHPGTVEDAGAAYVFVRYGTQWVEQAKLTPQFPVRNGRFGDAVAVSGLAALVGSGNDDVNAVNTGSAYVFTRNGVNWIRQPRLTPSDAAAGDRFGNRCAMLDNEPIVAALDDDHAGGVDAGSVYVFQLGCPLGDLNCDSRVDFLDIDPFLLALFHVAGYAAAYPACDRVNGDFDADGLLTFLDLDPFLMCVFGACP